jgi:hypothetical protein
MDMLLCPLEAQHLGNKQPKAAFLLMANFRKTPTWKKYDFNL